VHFSSASRERFAGHTREPHIFHTHKTYIHKHTLHTHAHTHSTHAHANAADGSFAAPMADGVGAAVHVPREPSLPAQSSPHPHHQHTPAPDQSGATTSAKSVPDIPPLATVHSPPLPLYGEAQPAGAPPGYVYEEPPSRGLLPKPVSQWSKAEVRAWIEQVLEANEMEGDHRRLLMGGGALVVLTKVDFQARAPDVGDVLFEQLQRLIRQ
jgi:hypothetical protein